MKYVILNLVPNSYKIIISRGYVHHEIVLSQRETVFFQLILQSLRERMEDKLPGGDIAPDWKNPNLN